MESETLGLNGYEMQEVQALVIPVKCFCKLIYVFMRIFNSNLQFYLGVPFEVSLLKNGDFQHQQQNAQVS